MREDGRTGRPKADLRKPPLRFADFYGDVPDRPDGRPPYPEAPAVSG